MLNLNAMKYTILILTLFYSIIGLSQGNDNSGQTNNAKHFFIAANFSTDVCYRTLKIVDASSIGASIVYDDRNKNEIIKIGYSTGINACYFLTEKIALEIGFQYSDKGYERKWSNLLFGSMIDPRYGFVYDSTNLPKKIKYNYNDYYLDIPFRVKYFFGNKRINFVTSAGLTTNIFIKEVSTGVLEYSNGDIERQNNNSTFDYKKIDLSPTFSLGVNYKITESMYLSIEPTFRYGILKIIDAPLTGYLYSGGLNILYYYKF
jgi:hypothetical protein